MKKAFTELPPDYEQILEIDLQKDKKLSICVNLAALAVAIIMMVPMHFYIPITTLFDMSKGLGAYCFRFGAFFAAMVAYIILHELVHGITMKLFGTKKIKYGFTGLYAFAGSDDYYPKKPYIIIALAPIAVWGIVIAVINLFVPYEWFWVVWFIQVMNISGAAGDVYVTARFSQMPADILVKDHGVGMKVYSHK